MNIGQRPLGPSAPRQWRRCRELVAVVALALVAGACGGGDDGPSLAELANDRDGGVDIDLGDLEVNSDGDGDNVSVSGGGVDSAFGTDLPRPDWLDPWVELPEGININLAINDTNTGERVVQGVVEGGNVEAIQAQQRAMLEAVGYAALQDSGYFVAQGRPPVRIQIGDTGQGSVGYFYEHSFEDEQTLRDLYAPVEGDGVLTAWINNEVLMFEGTCTVRSDSGQFAAADGTASLTVEERDGEQNYVLGNITISTAEDFESWNVLQVDENGNQPAISVRPDSFQFDGFMVGVTTPDPVSATLEVKCG